MKNWKKLMAGFCVAAMVSSMVVPVWATDDAAAEEDADGDVADVSEAMLGLWKDSAGDIYGFYKDNSFFGQWKDEEQDVLGVYALSSDGEYTALVMQFANDDRETLIDNILGASEQIEEDFDEDDEEETTLEDVEDEDDTDEDDGEEEDVEAEPIDDEESLAEEIEDRVSEMETEEIADLLVEAGISAKGKRQALINKLIKAVQDGAIAINGKGENEEEPEDDDYEDDDYEDEDVEDEGDEEDVNDLSNPNIKPARKKALKALKSMLEKKYDDGKLKAVTMKKALKAYYDESADEIDDMDNDELFDAYLQLKMLFIDDEGDEVEEGAPYTLNGEPYCCGQPLQYNEEDDTFICEICGGEYESEEE